MLVLLDAIFSFLFFTLLPGLIYAGIFCFAVAGVVYLCESGKGYTYVQISGLLFVLSGICLCYHKGYTHADKSVDNEWFCWFIGMVWMSFCAVCMGFLISMRIPTLIVAVILWGFLIIGTGDISSKNEDDVDYNVDYDSVIDDVDPVDD